MNLQMMALLSLVKSGKTLDREDPVIQNILFDVQKLIHETDDTIRNMKKKINYMVKNLYNNTTPQVSNSHKYDKIVNTISTILFDDISYNRITTVEQIEWKEYFHGLYDLVVFPYQSDKTHYVQMVSEIYKYYTVLKPPEKHLDPRDPLYVDVEMCNDLFRHLKAEHKKMMVPKLFRKFRKIVESQVNKRVKLQKMTLELKNLYKLQNSLKNLEKV